MPAERLLCIDVANLIIRHHRAPHGGEVDLSGQAIGGATGTIRQIIDIYRRERPTHLLIARDSARDESFRREVSAAYKAHRADADEQLARQFSLTFAAMEALGWPVVSRDRYEADDVIASAAARFAGQTIVVSGDKDLLALCSETVTVCLLRPGGVYERCRAVDCQRLMGVRPEQVVDLKALAGDSSDGITGITGVGAKTACALLAAHQDLASIYQAIDAGVQLEGLKPHLREKVIGGREQARTSYQLARLVSTLDIDTDALAMDRLPLPDEHPDALRDLGLGALLRPTIDRELEGLQGEQRLARLFDGL